MEINFVHENVDVDINEEQISEWVEEVIETEEKEMGEITVVFCDDEYLLDVNREHLNHDYYTDIITFDYVVGDLIMGELYISVDRIADNAKEFAVDFLTELQRVIIHGVLHLCGYPDATDTEKQVMRSKENEALSILGVKIGE